MKRRVGDGEARLYHHLARLAPRYNGTFSTLVLPAPLEVDRRRHKLKLPFYAGEHFDQRWDEASGGARLGLDLAIEMVGVISDLATIGTEELLDDRLLMAIPKVAYHDAEAVAHAMGIARALAAAGYLTGPDLDGVAPALSTTVASPLILNNGDFYPRNLIRKPDGKVVLVDWETWNANSPFYVLDHPENVAAVAFVHMWGNEPWRAEFVRALEAHHGFERTGFHKGIVLKALELAGMSLDDQHGTGLVRSQVSLLRAVVAEG